MKFSKLLLDGFWICVRRNHPAERHTVFHIRDGKLAIDDSFNRCSPSGTEKEVNPTFLTAIDESIIAALRNGDSVTIYKT